MPATSTSFLSAFHNVIGDVDGTRAASGMHNIAAYEKVDASYSTLDAVAAALFKVRKNSPYGWMEMMDDNDSCIDSSSLVRRMDDSAEPSAGLQKSVAQVGLTMAYE